MKNLIKEHTVYTYAGRQYASKEQAVLQHAKELESSLIENYNKELPKSSPYIHVGLKGKLSNGKMRIWIISKEKNGNYDNHCCIGDNYCNFSDQKYALATNKEILDYILEYDDYVHGDHFDRFMQLIYQCCQEHPEYYPKIIQHLSTLSVDKESNY